MSSLRFANSINFSFQKLEKLQKHGSKELCSVCNIRIDHANMEQHLKGKKHISLFNQAKMKNRINQQVSSEGIYITGIQIQMSKLFPEKFLFCLVFFKYFMFIVNRNSNFIKEWPTSKPFPTIWASCSHAKESNRKNWHVTV